MFDFRIGEWRRQTGVLAELVPVPASQVGRRFRLQSADSALVLHVSGAAPTYLTGDAGDVTFVSGDALLLLPRGSVTITVEPVGIGSSGAISFRATLAVSSPVLLAKWLETDVEGAEVPLKAPATSGEGQLGHSWPEPTAAHDKGERDPGVQLTLDVEEYGFPVPDFILEDDESNEAGSEYDPSYVSLDGLAGAVERAPSGATLHLQAGTYRLRKPLAVWKPLTLIGQGIEHTRIVCDGQHLVLQYSGDGMFQAEDLTIEHDGALGANAMIITQSENTSPQVELRRCRFTGAVDDQKGDFGGVGLWVAGSVTGKLEECVAAGNSRSGIVCQLSTGSLTLANCACLDNGWYGIYLSRSGEIQVAASICERNGRDGIITRDHVRATLAANTCTKNGWHGVTAGDETVLHVQESTCSENQDDGIAFFQRSSGVVMTNECERNAGQGIVVADASVVEIVENRCKHNSLSGIAYISSAESVLRGNVCDENDMSGIIVGESAKPLLW